MVEKIDLHIPAPASKEEMNFTERPIRRKGKIFWRGDNRIISKSGENSFWIQRNDDHIFFAFDQTYKGYFSSTNMRKVDLEETDERPFIEFLKKVVPKTLEAIWLVKAVLKEAKRRNFLLGCKVFDFFFFEDETTGDQTGDIFTDEWFFLTKKEIMCYTAASLGFSFPVLNVLNWFMFECGPMVDVEMV